MRRFIMPLAVVTSLFAIWASSAQSSLKILSEMSFAFIPAGIFLMGDFANEGFSPDEAPAHHVSVSAFFLSSTEVTNAQYCLFLNSMGNRFEGGGYWIALENPTCLISADKRGYQPKAGFESHPVVCVTWYGARAFAEWVGGRLPTEAEWEYAARNGGEAHQYPSGDRLNHNQANFVGVGGCDSYERSSPVGMFASTKLGLYDIIGNVWEWCGDWYDENYYAQSGNTNPEGPLLGEQRVIRGGSWSHSRWNSRAMTRGRYQPQDASEDIGFRIVMPVAGQGPTRGIPIGGNAP